jgi:hypothetical protein
MACPKHGPECDYNLKDHPLPSQGWGYGPDNGADDDPDPTGEEADTQAERVYGR